MLKSETLAVHAVMIAYQPGRKKKKSRDPSCDVSCISTNIQDGGQLKFSNENISRRYKDNTGRNNTGRYKNSLVDVYILFWSRFQMRQSKILLPFPFNYIDQCKNLILYYLLFYRNGRL